jgi:hypothetical protein
MLNVDTPHFFHETMIEVRAFEERAAAAEWLPVPKATLFPPDDRK